ncbi:hydroxyacylglutathione hydrolase [Tahibacter amnicola]|uniref:Hydroxyacylglutathione hydrolase n=1 Tax=Tahibacter amnicola TaxID=2976241 RepID=A0ABY6BKQ3_9GAMM|nr:hydroxyacylglutathione hydrolase [Tahibacter amnicola]UXI69620.1 hydroxyacylglutathione hydrolase [Tahibacter amnicola]
MRAVLRLISIPAFDDNYFWLATDAAGNALAIDPGADEPVTAALAQHGLTLRAILVTHHHHDHIGGVASLRLRFQVPVFAPPDSRIPDATHPVADGDLLEFIEPGCAIRVIGTPGHTSSHVSYHTTGAVFCGDTLFSVGCGRLFEGTPEQMLASLDTLAALPDDTQVYCAHEYTLANCAFAASVDPDNPALAQRIAEVRARRARLESTVPSSIGLERATNPFLRVDAPGIVAWGLREHGIAPHARVDRFAALRRGKDVFRIPVSW